MIKTSLVTLAAAFTAFSLSTAPAIAQDTYVVDPVHSFIVFKTNHMGVGNAYGFFEDFEGEVVFNDEDPSQSKIKLTVRTASVDTNNEERDKHLRSTDFFNVREFPTAVFESTEVKKTGDETYEVAGDLTLLGQTKPVTATFTEIGKGQGMQGETRRGGEAVLTFKRSDYGMNKYIEEGVLGDEATLTIALEGVLQE